MIVVIFALISVVGFMAYDFQGIGKFTASFLPWDLSANTYAVIIMAITAVYVITGGMLSVVLTDVAQFVIMAICSLIIAGIAMAKVAPEQIAAIVPAGWSNPFFGWSLDLAWQAPLDVLKDERGRGRLLDLRPLLHRHALQGHPRLDRRPRARTTTCSASWPRRRRARRR